jgi:hypothetical protein
MRIAGPQEALARPRRIPDAHAVCGLKIVPKVLPAWLQYARSRSMNRNRKPTGCARCRHQRQIKRLCCASGAKLVGANVERRVS